MIVKYISEENEGYWILLKDVPEPDQKHETFTIRIPKSNSISTIDWLEVQKYVREVSDVKLAARRKSVLSAQRR